MITMTDAKNTSEKDRKDNKQYVDAWEVHFNMTRRSPEEGNIPKEMTISTNT